MIPLSGDQKEVEFFGKYTHAIYLRTIDDVNRCIPIILSIVGEGVEDVPPVEDKEHGGFTVDLVTNEQMNEAQIASIQQVEGVLSCSCNEDIQESGVAGS